MSQEIDRLDDLPDQEFSDEVRYAIWSDVRWAVFEEPEIVDRTFETLAKFKASVERQLGTHDLKENPDWARRARRFLTQVMVRYAQTKRRIRNLNREETAEMAAFEKKWSTFAFDLAEALEGSNAEHLLDQIQLRNELPAREWLRLRRAQRQGKTHERQATAS